MRTLLAGNGLSQRAVSNTRNALRCCDPFSTTCSTTWIRLSNRSHGTAHGPSRKGALAQRQLRRHAAADGSSAEGQPSLEDPRADAGHYSQNADAGRSTLDAEDPVRDVLRNPFCRLEVYVVRGVSERPSRLIKMKITAGRTVVGLSMCLMWLWPGDAWSEP